MSGQGRVENGHHRARWPATIANVGDRLGNDVLPAPDAGLTTAFTRRGPWGYRYATRPEVERAHVRIDGLAESPMASGSSAFGSWPSGVRCRVADGPSLPIGCSDWMAVMTVVEIEAVVVEFRPALAHLAMAGQEVAAIANRCQLVSSQAAATGMTGVARQMIALAGQATAMQQPLTVVSTSGEQVIAALRTVTDEMSIAAAGEYLTTATGQIDVMRGDLVAVANRIAEIKRQVEVALRGAQPGPLLGMLDALRHRLAAVVHCGDAARRRIASVVLKTILLGRSTLGANHGSPSPSAQVAPSPVGSARAPTLDLQAAFDDMPVFPASGRIRAKTHGRWVDPDGTMHALVSGEHDGVYQRVNQFVVTLGLLTEGRGVLAASDVELKFALGMWETWQHTGVSLRQTIVINHPRGPCEGEYGCDELVSRLLPPDGELTVHWPGGHRRTYRGEAE